MPGSTGIQSATTQDETTGLPVVPAESQLISGSTSAPASEQAGAPEQRPQRRYRFDRPAAPAASTASRPAPVAPAAPRAEFSNASEREVKDAPVAAFENEHQLPESVAEKSAAPNIGVREHGRDNRQLRGARPHNAERPQEKEAEIVLSASPDSLAPAPIIETTLIDTKIEAGGAAAGTETPIEDLPPLEYAELQAANSRRRRRRRPSGNGTLPAKPAITEQVTSLVPSPVQPTQPAGTTLPAPIVPNVPARAITPSTSYTIQSGFTVNQMNQGNDAAGPFMGPEPSPARGSTMPTPVRGVRPGRNGISSDGQRGITGTTSITPAREGGLSSGAVNHMANVISQAMQMQTDRMVAELRRANQGPTNISVALPSFPSTERVGVFVDVANLLYSARTMRINVDFGKLLDFLRGNRRLVRAQAYCPTSPQPGDDQMFLQAVKGLGYRITTKDYKTFSSGAKKADLDLDLCMDVVRIVDGRAVDCIVLVSGDGDFIPMLDYCSDHGVRVEVAAFDESMSASLRQSCDLFINLSLLEEVRA